MKKITRRNFLIASGKTVGTLAAASAFMGCASPEQAENCFPRSAMPVRTDDRLTAIDDIVENYMGQGYFPGATIVVARGGKIVYEKAYGYAMLNDMGVRLDDPRPMQMDIMFDMASCTKIMATTQSIMKLYSEGTIDLNATVASYIPEFAKNGKENVTVHQLLTHTSGLPQWKAMFLYIEKDKAKVLCQNCVGCESCKNVCAGGIDLPRLIREIRSRLTDEQGGGVEGTLMAAVMKNRKMFHSLLKFASYAQKPFTGGTQFQRHLPAMFLGKHGFKALPAIANEAFRDRWAKIAPRVATPRYRVAIFGGCAQDFIYPEQLEACVKVLGARGVAVEYPMAQTCCGLPLEMMGQRKTSVDVAKQNLEAFDASKNDAIITLCASCASHLKHVYPHILEGKADAARVQLFSDKVTDYSSFVHDVLGLTEKDFNNSGEKVTYHASCHICRGLGVTKAPRDLIADAATYVPCAEEDVCCGFGGTYSMKFPEISGTLLAKKLKHIEETGASRVVMDCPGCVMQLRGGVEKQGMKVKVSHIAELVAENLKH